jgi:inner membrane protein
MDSFTQIVLGAGVGELVLGKKVGNKAMLWGAVAGTIPDLDVFYRFFTDPLNAMLNHRGFMHSIVFCSLFAPVLGWIISKLYKSKEASWKEWSMLSWWALVTHPLLDAFTTWGTQLFWPFEYRVVWNGVFVIDPLYTLPYTILLIMAMRKRREDPKRMRLAKIGIILSTSYLLLGVGFRWIAKNTFENRLQEKHLAYTRIDVKPMPFNILYWEATAESDSVFYNGHYSLFGDAQKISFRAIPKNHELAAKTGIASHPDFARLVFISKGFYALETKGDTLLFHDLRFGQVNGISDALEPRSSFIYLLRKTANDQPLEFHQGIPGIANGFSYLDDYFKKVIGG